ncbi:PAS domain S-box protein [Amantichitinum ursilacus]|uniref:histidine kinase n=1 Tax=Amantichitinum ursilacus TaxID=857265 RepID=A0A0N1JTQ3_9NEIS|nr:PAS domain S-box protein [Amantichitinum ursilacus]KPC55236.1 Non-motile and phage-resistance protein [Amantichitinum ursilacus]
MNWLERLAHRHHTPQPALKPLRTALLWFYIALLLFSGLTLAWLTLRDYNANIEEARAQDLLLARSLDEQASRTFLGAEQSAQATIERLAASNGIDSTEEHDLSAETHDRTRQTTQVGEMITIDSQGILHSSSLRYPSKPMDMSDRTYFSYHRDVDDARFLLSPPVLSRTDGRWLIPVSHRINKQDGSFGGVLLTGIDPAYFTRFYDSLKLPRGTHIKLLRSDGVVLMNYPFALAELGRNVRQPDGVRFNGPESAPGSHYRDMGSEGSDELLTYLVSNGDLPLVVSVSSDVNTVMQKFHSDLVSRAISAIVLILVVSVLLYILLRQIRRVEQIESRLYLTQFTVDEAPDAMLWADRQAFIRYANRAASMSSGYTNEELVTYRFLDLFPNITDPQWQDFWYKLTVDKRLVYITHQRDRSGNLLPVEITFNYIEFFQEAYACTTVRDITEQQNSERELRRHRDHLQDLVLERTAEIRTVLDASPLAIMLSVRNTIRLVNPAFEILFGYAASDIIGLPTRVIHASEERYSELISAIWGRINTGGVFRGEIELYRRDHSGFWAMLYAKALVPGDPGKGMITVVEDVTAQRIAAQALRQSERLKRTIIDTTADGFILIDTHRHIVDVNNAFCQQLGFRREDLIGKQPHMLWGDTAQQLFPEQLVKDGNGVSHIAEISLPDNTGRKLPFLVNSASINDEQQRLEYAFAFLTNISHLKDIESRLVEAKESAEEANVSKSAFLANMSHELRTPMHAILSFSEMGISKSGKADPQAMARYFERIHSSGNRLLVLLNDLLDMSRLEANKMRYDKTRHCLQHTVQGAANEIAPLLAGKHLKLFVDDMTPPLEGWFDQSRMMQVVVNLLSNAIKFGPPESTIEINFISDATLDGAPAIGLTVRDHGPGIPDNELDAIFDKFIQSTRVRSSVSGTGLGLAISKQIMEDHGGRIVASNHPHGGAVFTVWIPVGEDD